MLDDSFVHSVDLRGATTNSSTPSASTTRLLLVCDVRHPDASLLDDAAVEHAAQRRDGAPLGGA